MKKDLYEQLARLGKAAASAARLELLDLLCQGPRTVETLAREAGLTVANTSQHLRVLHAARLVETEKVGLFVTYRLADESVCAFFQTMRSLGEKRLAEVDRSCGSSGKRRTPWSRSRKRRSRAASAKEKLSCSTCAPRKNTGPRIFQARFRYR